jgi:hypothetical protein
LPTFRTFPSAAVGSAPDARNASRQSTGAAGSSRRGGVSAGIAVFAATPASTGEMFPGPCPDLIAGAGGEPASGAGNICQIKTKILPYQNPKSFQN